MERIRVAPNAFALDVDSRWLTVLVVQALTLVAYATLSGTEITAARYLVYPFVWIDVAAWAVLRADLSVTSRRYRGAAAIAGAGYFAVMLYVAGFLGHGHVSMTGLRVISAPPGWGPMVAYQNRWFRLYLVPFQIVGYAALSYLLYAALLNATRAAVSGFFGLLSCVGCAWTLVAPLVGVAAGASTVGATLYDWSYDLTTLVFLLTVALLIRAIERNAGG